MATTTREPLEGLRRHKLMPAEARKALAPLGSEATRATLKLFSPYGRYTFYVTEFDGEDTLFGFDRSPLGPDCDEWGYSSLSEIAAATVLGGVPAIERDRFFDPVEIGPDGPEEG